jgi:hypothetical protein
MLIVYDKNTHEIVGHCSRVYDSGKWREATLEELYPNRDRSNLATAYMPDDARFVGYGTTNWRLRKDESGAVLGIERLPGLLIGTDAQDDDKDGVPDIPADGKSVAHIRVSTADNSDTEITFRTTRGTLSARSVKTSGGKAVVDLRSGKETVAANVTASAAGYRTATISIEFVPVAATAGAGKT